MKEFVVNFKSSLVRDHPSNKTELNEFLVQIELALGNSERLVGTKVPFDLESLMVVLQDLVASKDSPISLPTFALLLHIITEKRMTVGQYNIANTRQAFNERAQKLLDLLRRFISENCFKPIRIGYERQSFDFLDLLYTPLFAVLGNGNFRDPATQWIFTTNWDLCLKQWLDYAMREIGVEDGTVRDHHGDPVFKPGGWANESSVSRMVVTLHGSLGFIRKKIMIRDGAREEIHKVTDPRIYFEGNPSELANAFMIFPLEAVGYEQSVRSPYLDMLNLLKQRLKSESNVFIIGFSLRDQTIAAIFEEVLRERAQTGDWQPLGQRKFDTTEKDTARFRNARLKIFLIDSSPKTIIDYLREHGYENLANALLPIAVTFPSVIGPDEKDSDLVKLRSNIGRLLSKLIDELRAFGLNVDSGDIKRGIDPTGLSLNLASAADMDRNSAP